MMKRVLLMPVLVASHLFAADAGEILDKTIEKYSNMNSFYAEFEQFFCDENAGICQSFEGRTYYMKPNYFRMEIDDPKQIFVGDSVSLWIYFPDENRVIRQTLEQLPFQINPDQLFADYKEDYNTEIVAENDDYYEISMNPKEDTDVYRSLQVKINKDTYEIIGITVNDEAGTENKFEFTKLEMNKKLSKKIFEFNIPKGATVDEF
jgi:chaperone LolA